MCYSGWKYDQSRKLPNEISPNISFNKTAESLCNQHKYKELNDFLLADQVINLIETKEHFQAYYYLGCSCFHVENNLRECDRNLNFSLAEGTKYESLDSLSRLALASLSIVKVKLYQRTDTLELIKKSLVAIDKTPYESNLNKIVFYLNALAYYGMEGYQATAIMIEEGISFATKHDSHFMLANLFYLLAQISNKAENINASNVALNRSDIFEDLYKEKIYKRI